jgi:heat shock protein HslJ
MKKLIILAVLFFLTLSGCLNNIGKKTQDVNEVKVENALLGTLWELQSFGPIGLEKKVLPDTKVTFQFAQDDRMTGAGGCNHYSGSYKIGANNNLSIVEISSTLIYCYRSTKQELQYFEALRNTSAFDVDQNHLQLFYNDGKGVLNFAFSKD